MTTERIPDPGLTKVEADALLSAALRVLDEDANHCSDRRGPSVATLDLIDGARKLEAAARARLVAA